jgi:RNA polymerase sigma-70 factor (ECF subfamily)
MADDLGNILRAVNVPDPARAEELWAEYRAGGPGAEDAIRTLLAWYGHGLYRHIWGLVRSDAADDVYQEVLERLHRHKGRFEWFGEQVRPWLRCVADNACRNHRRREARRVRREARRGVSPGDAAPPDGRAELSEAVAAALDRLPARLRRVVALVYFEGLTHEAAGREVGACRDTVARRLDEAMTRLRGLLPAGAVAATGTAGVESVLAAGRPVVSSARLGELATEAVRRAAGGGPGFGMATGVLLAGLTLGGVGLAGWAAMPAPEPAVAQVPPPAIKSAPVAERETLQAKNLRLLHAEVLPKLTAGLAKLVGSEPVVTHTRADGSEVVVHLEGRRPFLPTHSKPPRAMMRFCVLSRTLTAVVDVPGTGEWQSADVDNILIKADVLGGVQKWNIPIQHLGLRAVFDALPPDDRAGAEFDRFHLDGTPYGGPDLIMPGWAAELTANARYLYLAREGHLLVRDAGGGFTGWRRAGLLPDGVRQLAATDRHLFAATAREVLFRPADPAAHDWRPFGPLPPAARGDDWRFAAAGDRLFVRDGRQDLWARPAAAGPGEWQTDGRLPVELTVLFGGGSRLFCWTDDHVVWSTRAVLSRPAAAGGAWEPFGRTTNTVQHIAWAGRLVRWEWGNHGSPVEARPLTPGPAEWTRIGRVDSKADFLNWRW